MAGVFDIKFYLGVLKSNECQCGRTKHKRRAFCYSCYKTLPEDMASALYQRMRHGFEEAYEEVNEWLNDR